MPETGEGIADKNKNEKITVVRRTMPKRGRYDGFCLSTPLHAPPSPSTHTAVDVYSSTYYTAAHALVQVQYWDFHFFTSLRHPGERAVRRRESLSTPPARRIGHGRPLFRRGLRGLMCGAGVEPPRGRGRSSGARESQLFFGYVIPKIFQRSFWISLLPLPLPRSII